MNLYGKLLMRRECLLERIQELKTELDSLHKQLKAIDAEIEAAKAASVSLSVEERVELFRSLFPPMAEPRRQQERVSASVRQ